MDQSQEILLGHAIFASSEYGYHGYRCIARSISNKWTFDVAWLLTQTCLSAIEEMLNERQDANLI